MAIPVRIPRNRQNVPRFASQDHRHERLVCSGVRLRRRLSQYGTAWRQRDRTDTQRVASVLENSSPRDIQTAIRHRN
ncbi:hypothetical protein BH09CHL1_BH09CHL1_15890 [soil metagenome]